MKFVETCAVLFAGIWFGFLAVVCNGMVANIVVKHLPLVDRYAQIGVVAVVQLALFCLLALCIHQFRILKKQREIIRAIYRTHQGREVIKDLDYDLRETIKSITR